MNFLEPLVYACSMKLVIARQLTHAVSILILHKAYIASAKLRNDIDIGKTPSLNFNISEIPMVISVRSDNSLTSQKGIL